MVKKNWWRIVKEQQGFSSDDGIPALNKADGGVALSAKEKAELLADHFSKKMQVPDPVRDTPFVPLKTNKKFGKLQVDEKNVMKYLLNIDVKKATGPDDISPYILKKCARELCSPVTKLYQECIKQKKWPELWKIARVVAAHKKKSRAKVENYRPISLLSIVGKILESIIVDQLTIYIERNYLLSNKQFGFRQNRSTADLLLNLSTDWNKALDNGKYTYVIALDIAGAFDRVWHKGLIAKLLSFGLDSDVTDLMENYLMDRFLKVAVNGYTSKECKIGASVPQGSVLGPLLWNIYFNDILQLIPEAYAYADDCTLTFTCSDEDRKETIMKINETLKLISEWGEKWQITLAPEKTQVMLISRRRESEDNMPTIKLDGKDLPLQTNMHILGVQFDHHLSFTEHVKEIGRNCASKLACLRRISGLLDSKGCSVLYNSQVRSLMEYAPLVWSSCPPSYLRILDRIQKRATHIINSRNPSTTQLWKQQSLQHRRDVSGLCVFYKIHRMESPHLAPLRLPFQQARIHNTRGHTSKYELVVPFARTELYLRSFQLRYARMWNRMIKDIDPGKVLSLETFKKLSHQWRSQFDGLD